MIAPGAVVADKYELLDLIGSGGMGAVYKARNELTERIVAIKFLHSHMAEDKEVRTRFQREAKAAARVDHDNVCEVLDFGETEAGDLFLVMPLLRGMPLDETIRQAGPMDVLRACDIASQVYRALDAAHQKGVIHRDLKPENVFLTKVGEKEDFVKILDFGITKFGVGEEGKGTNALTQTGHVIGTPYYMAPEQARAKKDIDGRVDVYSTGVMLYEMLTTKRPIEGDSINELLWKLWHEPVQPLRSHRPSLPDQIDEVVLKAMARDPDERYRSAAEALDALSAVAQLILSGAGQARRTAATGLALDETAAPVAVTPAAQQSPDVEPSLPVPAAQPLDPADKPEAVPEGQEQKPKPAPEDGAVSSDRAQGGPPWHSAVDDTGAAVSTFQGQEREALEPSRGMLPYLAIPIVTVVVAVGVFVYLSATSPEESTSAQVPVLAPADATPELAQSTSPSLVEQGLEAGSGAHEPERVSITIKGVPDDAQILLDGAAMDGPDFSVEKGAKLAQLEVRAAGFRPWTKEISLERDSLWEPRMTPQKRRPDGEQGSHTERPRPDPVPTQDDGLPAFGEVP